MTSITSWINPHAQAMISDLLDSRRPRPSSRTLRLRPWAHMLGFRGHFSTKSRRYSTTLTVPYAKPARTGSD